MQVPAMIRRWIFWDFGRNSIPYEIVCAAYIALLLFLPAASTGWFNEGESVTLRDGSRFTLHRDGVELSLTWPSGIQPPDAEALETWARERFGEGTSLRPARSNETNRLVITPGGMSWSASSPLR
jgi:hypothetical protein